MDGDEDADEVDNNLTRKVAASDALLIASLKGLVAGAVNIGLADETDSIADKHGRIAPTALIAARRTFVAEPDQRRKLPTFATIGRCRISSRPAGREPAATATHFSCRCATFPLAAQGRPRQLKSLTNLRHL